MSKNYYGFKKPTTEQQLKMIKAITEERYSDIELPKWIHLGKYASVNRFYFHHNNFEHWKNLGELREFIEELDVIEDEYGDEISKYRFWKMAIENRDMELNSQWYMKVDGVWCHRDGGDWC